MLCIQLGPFAIPAANTAMPRIAPAAIFRPRFMQPSYQLRFASQRKVSFRAPSVRALAVCPSLGVRGWVFSHFSIFSFAILAGDTPEGKTKQPKTHPHKTRVGHPAVERSRDLG